MTRAATDPRPVSILALTVALTAAGLIFASMARAAIIPVNLYFNGTAHPVPDKVDCTSTPGTCESYFHATGTDQGAWQGHGYVTLHGHLTPQGMIWAGTDYETFTSTPCGSGTITFPVTGWFSGIDLSGPAISGQDDWQIGTGSGTGQLQTATGGSGHDNLLIRADGSFQDHVVGYIVCQPIGASRHARATPSRHRHRRRHHHHNRHNPRH
jgi:hypothetical protein